jgi:hypothetical protein
MVSGPSSISSDPVGKNAMRSTLLELATLAFTFADPSAASEPLRLLPQNTHYFEFRGKPTLLVTSGEHYGAVLNLDFDYTTYLDTLARDGLNLTRTFSGTYREVPGSFKIQGNTLAPKPNRYIAPWAKVADATADSPERFDLDRFDPDYFARLKSFLTEAARRGIVVEYVLFCPFYEQVLWDVNPLNARNNANQIGNCDRDAVYTLGQPDVLERQLAFVRKAVSELNEFDNLYYEICNEPYARPVAHEWQARIAEEIVATEKPLPKKHLIAQNIANEQAKVDRTVHPAVSILNYHYAATDALRANDALGLPIVDDETGFDGTGDRTYRTEAWEFLLSGGAGVSNLDYSFTTEHEDGTAKVEEPTPGGGGPALRTQLATLKRFLEALDFPRMRRAAEGSIVFRPQGRAEARNAIALTEPGRAYAVYLRDGGPGDVELELPAGRYRYLWIDPRSGHHLGEGELVSASAPASRLRVTTPAFEEDIALRVINQDPPAPRGSLPRLKVSDNRRFLVTEQGEPFFYLGDTAWELFHRLNRDEAEHYLADRVRKGFTVIQAVILAEFDGLNTPNALGDEPLLENDPTRPNEAYFAHVDVIVDRAAALGLYTGMLPTWGDKVNKKWGIGPEIFTPESAQSFGRFLGSRYRDKPIIWILGGDRDVETDTHRAIWSAMAAGIHEGDGGRHLITMHPQGGQTSAKYYPDTPWLDFHMLQSGHSARNIPTYEQITRLYELSPTKPCLDAEPCYEDHPIDWKAENGWFDEYDVRKALYWSVFAGGCGVTYGCHDIWQFWQPGRDPISAARTPWRDAIKLPASAQGQHLRRLIESRPVLDRIPDQTLIVGDPGTGGEHVRATRARDGSYAMIYIPTRKAVSIDLSKLSGDELHVYWFDPRDGAVEWFGKIARNRTRSFTPPFEGPDWVLVLDDARLEYPPPGEQAVR